MKQLFVLLLTIFTTSTQYTVSSTDIGGTYIKLGLKYTGPNEYYVKPKSKVVKDLVFHFKALTYSEFSFKIYDLFALLGVNWIPERTNVSYSYYYRQIDVTKCKM